MIRFVRHCNKHTATKSRQYRLIVPEFDRGLGRNALLAFAFIVLFITSRPGLAQDPRAGFGKNWIRNHPFTTMTWIRNGTLDVPQYKNANFNSLLTAHGSQIKFAAPNGWPLHFNLLAESLTPPVISKINAASAGANVEAWHISDEPSPQHLPGITDIANYLRANKPDSLIYLNVANVDPTFLDTLMTTVKPDVLMYDYYPFYSGGHAATYGPVNIDEFFSQMTKVLTKTKQYNVPLFSWMQTFTDDNEDWRAPSESELRMQLFVSLTAGVKGIGHFVYEPVIQGGGYEFGEAILKDDLTPDRLYSVVQELNPEIENLGQSLRYLESTGMRFLRGRHVIAGNFTTPNKTPSTLSNWSAGSGGDPHIATAAVDTADPANIGLLKDGLIGFFTDDDGQRYFMLTNMFQGTTLTPEQASLGFKITFDNSVNSLWRLNRATGLAEEVQLTNHILNITMQGGTGDLFKYDAGDFAGLAAIITGDFNEDGIVDAADYTTWRNKNGTQEEYDIWKANFGQVIGEPGSTANLPVPEPAGASLIVLGWIGFTVLERRTGTSRTAEQLSR